MDSGDYLIQSSLTNILVFLGGTIVPVQETQESRVWSLGWEDPLKKEMATKSNILAQKIPWTEEPGGLPSIGISQARILEWITISSSKVSSQLRNWTCISCLAGWFLTTEPPGKPKLALDK